MNQIVLLPVFVLVALLFTLLVMTGRARVAAVTGGIVKPGDISLGQAAWPPQVTQIGRAYQNQLELPVVFYALVALVLATDRASTTFVVLEWLFVAARLAHAWVHVTSNHLRRRFNAFLAGVVVLAAMWLWFAARTFGIA